MNRKNIKPSLGKILDRFSRLLGSNKFFWIIMAVFVLQAAWVALSLNHSGFYDEQFHYGVAQFYSQFINPFQSSQDTSWDQWGDVARHPSYLYYYFLGKIINLLNIFGFSYVDKLIVLRFISIIFFALGLYVYRKVLLSLALSTRIINFSMFFFISIPAVTLIAGQVSYDNPMFLVSGVFLLKLIYLIKANTLNVYHIIIFITIGVLGSLIKFSFLPLFLAGLLALVINLVINYRKKLLSKLKTSWLKLPNQTKIFACIFIIIGGFLFIERYAINTFYYGAPLPECSKSLNEERCQNYVTWNRNHLLKSSNKKTPNNNIIKYLGSWGNEIINTQYGLAFMTGIKSNNTLSAVIKPPLPIVHIFFQACVLIGTTLLLVYLRKILSTKERILIFGLGLFFIIILLLYNYGGYRKYGTVVAANGRYIFPVLPIFIAMGATALVMSLKKIRHGSITLAIITILALTQGGGIISTVLQAETSWYWQNNTILKVNGNAKKILKPLVNEYSQ